MKRVANFEDVLLRFRAREERRRQRCAYHRAWYASHLDERRKDAREGKESRYWLRRLRAEIAHG